jgi:hypothetical protein
MLKNILFTIIILGASAFVTLAQSNDNRNKPPKKDPPVVSPKEKEKPKENPPKGNNPEKGNKPKKPDNRD